MKILKAFDKEVNKVKYYHYRINLPKKVVEESGLIGKELKVKAEKEKDYNRKRISLNISHNIYKFKIIK